LAVRSDELVPLVRTYGTSILKIEARAPGLSSRIAGSYSREALEHIAGQAAPGDLTRLAGLARTSDFQAAQPLIERGYQRYGSAFLDRIDYKAILATGACVAMATAAYQISDGVGDAVRDSPEAVTGTLGSITHWSVLPFVAIGVVVVLAFLSRRGLLRFRRPPTARDRAV
jgi:hypothetical protein